MSMGAARTGSLLGLSNVAFRYPGRNAPALAGASLEIGSGDFLAVAGPTGGGKSTLLKLIAGLLPGSSQGRLEGERRASSELRCGVVFQSPDDQIFSRRAWDEVAFGPRNAGVDEAELAQRVEEALAVVGLAGKGEADPSTFSGGQKQRLAIAAALALAPQLLVLDEPLSQLDPAGAREVLAALGRLRRERGVALVLAEHRLDECLDLAGFDSASRRMVAVAGGKLVYEGSLEPGEPRRRALTELSNLGLRVPIATEVARLVPAAWAAGVRDEASLDDWLAPSTTTTAAARYDVSSAGAEVLAAEAAGYKYAASGFGLEPVDLRIHAGERLALLGSNGSGKSTLLALLGGALVPQTGAVRGTARRGYTFQNPDAMLIRDTVLEEAAFGPRFGLRLKPLEAEARARTALAALGLDGRPREAPLALSRGQRLRLAAASVLSMNPEVLLLDEPTTGQDRTHIERLLQAVGEKCGCVVFSTHDVDLACAWATRAVVLAGGRVLADGKPQELLADESLIAQAGLRAPGVPGLCRRLGLPACRSVRELAALLQVRGGRA